jgi:hypothetical protein
MTGKWFPIVSSTPALCGFTNNFFGQHVSWHKTNVFHLTLSVDIARYRSVPEPGRMLVVLCLVVDLIADHRGMVLHLVDQCDNHALGCGANKVGQRVVKSPDVAPLEQIASSLPTNQVGSHGAGAVAKARPHERSQICNLLIR